jgi:hypothetical protein
MAKIYITEHTNPSYLLGAPLPVLAYPPLVSQTVVNTGATTQSAAFNTDTKIICIHTDSICSVEFGANPTATTASRRLAANSTEFFQVSQGHKVAVILNT